MQSCIKLMQLVFNKIAKVLKDIIQVAKNNNFKDSNLSKLEVYNTKLLKFTNYVNNLKEKDFELYIKDIFEDVKKLLQYFSTNVIKFIQSNNLNNVVEKDIEGLPKEIIELLKSFNNYIKTTNETLQNNKESLTNKMREYRDINNKDKVINESIDYILLLEEEPSAISSFISGGVGAIKGLFNVFSGNSEKVRKACLSFDGTLDKLNIAAEKLGSKNGYVEFFTSEGFMSALGGIFALVVTFALVKKAFSKIVNGIKNTWNDFWEWTRR